MSDLLPFDLIVTLIVALPLLSAVVNGTNLLFGDRFDYHLVQRLTCGAILLSFFGSVWVFVQVLADPTPREVIVYRWLFSGDLNVNVAFLIDSLSAIMMLIVTGFSFLIAVFSINYMHRDYSFTRYFSAFGLFVFAMLILVMGNSYVMLFFGWEAVGVCSYLMIGHYYHRVSAARAGTLAFVMNRVGDAGFLMGIFLIATNFKTVNYSEVFAKLDTIDEATATAIGLSLLLGAIGKSAQLPLGTWLAKAMEGPTPSSALIHAATMVTAGVYMIVRSNELYNMAPNALLVVAIVGALTALYGAMVGSTLSDIKGILAASTTTQLGLMFLACGLGAYVVAMFHLVAHAFLKSYLFLTAPSILHHMHTKADVTKREKTKEPVPFLYWATLIGSLLLVAVPFLAGWWKSEHSGGPMPMSWYVLMGAGLMSAFAILYYTARLTRKVFIEEAHGHDGGHDEHGEGHHAPTVMDLMFGPVVVLVLLGAVGFLLGLLPGGVEGTWFQKLLAPVVASQTFPNGGHPILTYTLMALLAVMLFSSWFTALYLERFKPELPGWILLKKRGLYNMALSRFWLDEFYDTFVIGPCKQLGHLLGRLDTNVIDRAVGAPAPAGKIRTAVSTWEDQYLGLQAVGAPHALVKATVPAHTQEEEDIHEDHALASEPTGAVGRAIKVSAATTGWVEDKIVSREGGVVGWLTGVAATDAAWVERRLVGRATGVLGRAMESTAALAGGVERRLVGPATGLLGRITEAAASVSASVEKHVIGGGGISGVAKATEVGAGVATQMEVPMDRGIHGGMTELNEIVAALTAWVEKTIFDTGVNKGMPLVTGAFGRALFQTEEILARPAVTGTILVASVAAVLVGVFVWS